MIENDFSKLAFLSENKPALINTGYSQVPKIQPSAILQPLQPISSSTDIFESVYRPNTRSFQSPLMQNGAKKVLDQVTGVYKLINNTPELVNTPRLRPHIDYTTKPKTMNDEKNSAQKSANQEFKVKSNLKRSMSIPNIVNLNDSESGRLILEFNLLLEDRSLLLHILEIVIVIILSVLSLVLKC